MTFTSFPVLLFFLLSCCAVGSVSSCSPVSLYSSLQFSSVHFSSVPFGWGGGLMFASLSVNFNTILPIPSLSLALHHISHALCSCTLSINMRAKKPSSTRLKFFSQCNSSNCVWKLTSKKKQEKLPSARRRLYTLCRGFSCYITFKSFIQKDKNVFEKIFKIV